MKNLFILTATVGLALTTLPAFGVGYTLTINESNPGAVVISAAGFAQGNDTNTPATFGVDLVNFLTTAATINSTAASSSTLGASMSGPVLNSFESDTFHATGAAKLDLNLFSTASSLTEWFEVGNLAFAGSDAVNLSAFAADLPTAGTTGSIYTGDSSGGQGIVVGTWDVTAAPVPEPTTLALAGLGFAGLLALRRKRTFGSSTLPTGMAGRIARLEH